MKIGLDIMGGDFAPETTVLGAILARKQLPANIQLVLIGDEEKIKVLFDRENARFVRISEENANCIFYTSELFFLSDVKYDSR